MFKRTLSLLLVIVAVIAMMTGCDLVPKSVTMEKVTFKIGYTTYEFCDDDLAEVIAGTSITCKNSAQYNELAPNETRSIACSFNSNGVEHDFTLVVWNNSDRKLKANDCVIREVELTNDGVHTIVPAAIMGVSLSDTYESFEQYFGKCDSVTENAGGNVYTWKSIPEKDGNYTITVIVKDRQDDFNTITTSIRLFVEPLESN